MLNDLREFINEVERLGECKVVRGAHWDLEIGAITEVAASSPGSPLVLFDEIEGYPAGYRLVSNLFSTTRRIALALGLPVEAAGIELVKAFRDREKGELRLIPPVEVKDAPIKENIHLGDDVDLFEFPAPRWRELDGGRYIGTGDMTIVRDPDEGWVNLSPQRVQIHDKSTATIYMGPSHHNTIIRNKYWNRGLSCPVAVSCGQEPLLWSVSARRIPWGIPEYDFTGGLRGRPVEVTKGVTTDLPIPASAEIVLEGEIVPPEVETRIEGPFGEWLGYYAGKAAPQAAFRVKSILHRNNPVIQGNPAGLPLGIFEAGLHIQKSAILWNELERQITGVKGVWMIDENALQSMPVISIKQEYSGHAEQAAMIAAACSDIAHWAGCTFIIVVDDDIDPTNMSEVLWAMSSRADPKNSIHIIPRVRASKTDPRIAPEQRKSGEFTHSIAIIIACKPYHWMKDFPQPCRASPELLSKTRKKWGKLLL